MPEAPVQNGSINIPTYLAPVLLTGFVLLMSGWVSTLASTQAQAMDFVHEQESNARFSDIEDEVGAGLTRVSVIETRLDDISGEVREVKEMATNNHDLLIRIAAKLEVD
tara:strand:- start:403 stop:729 length:327 start_codon:yes stop_codon:yes gene_type:complete